MLGAMKVVLKARYAATALGLVAAYGTYSMLAPPPPPLDRARKRAAEQAAESMAKAVPPAWRRKKLFVSPFDSDATGYVTRAVTQAVRRLDRAEIVEFRADTVEDMGNKLASVLSLDWPRAKGRTLEALKLASAAGAELVMLGRVNELSLTEGVARADVYAEVLDVKTGGRLWEHSAVWTPRFLERTVGLISPMKRAIAWILFVLLLPWAASPVVKRALGMESNAANALVLAGLVGLAAATAYVALAGDLTGWAGAFFLVALALGFFYNAGVLNYVAGLERDG